MGGLQKKKKKKKKKREGKIPTSSNACNLMRFVCYEPGISHISENVSPQAGIGSHSMMIFNQVPRTPVTTS